MATYVQSFPELPKDEYIVKIKMSLSKTTSFIITNKGRMFISGDIDAPSSKLYTLSSQLTSNIYGVIDFYECDNLDVPVEDVLYNDNYYKLLIKTIDGKYYINNCPDPISKIDENDTICNGNLFRVINYYNDEKSIDTVKDIYITENDKYVIKDINDNIYTADNKVYSNVKKYLTDNNNWWFNLILKNNGDLYAVGGNYYNYFKGYFGIPLSYTSSSDPVLIMNNVKDIFIVTEKTNNTDYIKKYRYCPYIIITNDNKIYTGNTSVFGYDVAGYQKPIYDWAEISYFDEYGYDKVDFCECHMYALIKNKIYEPYLSISSEIGTSSIDPSEKVIDMVTGDDAGFFILTDKHLYYIGCDSDGYSGGGSITSDSNNLKNGFSLSVAATHEYVFSNNSDKPSVPFIPGFSLDVINNLLSFNKIKIEE